MNFAERLTHLQKERKLNKKEIFETIGLSRTAYYRYETGEREPSISILTALADFFNVSTDYLLGRTDNPARL